MTSTTRFFFFSSLALVAGCGAGVPNAPDDAGQTPDASLDGAMSSEPDSSADAFTVPTDAGLDGDACVPQTCEQAGMSCGITSNLCGGLLQCGPCEAGPDGATDAAIVDAGDAGAGDAGDAGVADAEVDAAEAGPPPGTFSIFTIPSSESDPAAITSGPDGNLWFTEGPGSEDSGGKIGKLVPSTGTITEYSISAPSGSQATAITAGPDGNLWFVVQASGGADKVGKIVPSTGTITLYPITSQSGDEWGITAGPDGNLWFTELENGKIGRCTTTGTVTEWSIEATLGGAEPYGIAAGSDGNLWYTDQKTKVGKITTAGSWGEFTINGTEPEGIVSGPDGNLWFTEYSASSIGRMTTSAALNEYPTLTANADPAGITTGPDGALWFTEWAANKIGRITTAGTVTVEYSIPSGLTGPTGITKGPDGALWFTIFDSGKIGRVTP